MVGLVLNGSAVFHPETTKNHMAHSHLSDSHSIIEFINFECFQCLYFILALRKHFCLKH
jgi:hypothetical protein